MQEETLTTLKDILIPGLSMLVAGASVYFSYRQTRLQIKKNMRVQHIDRIRDEVVKFMYGYYVTLSINDTPAPTYKDPLQCIIELRLLLNQNKEKQLALLRVISEFNGYVHADELKKKELIQRVYDATHAAIQELEDEI